MIYLRGQASILRSWQLLRQSTNLTAPHETSVVITMFTTVLHYNVTSLAPEHPVSPRLVPQTTKLMSILSPHISLTLSSKLFRLSFVFVSNVVHACHVPCPSHPTPVYRPPSQPIKRTDHEARYRVFLPNLLYAPRQPLLDTACFMCSPISPASVVVIVVVVVRQQ